MPLPRGMTYIGLMPSGSRASVRAPGALVVEREREHPAEPRRASGPHSRQHSRTTSVSDSVTNRTPLPRSMARSSR